ncbi:Hypothetical_protein [Hexamita inflata]|uniref:Hypothetical_protein n=1 Tax=Hexamita inflata TaxID=28002 RepID=A0AA86NMF9_9EUKA|nr:Hypothetical protein HINF_LOCUS10315 [Hexamita inflata]
MLTILYIYAATSCTTKLTILMNGMSVNVKDFCPLNTNCLNMPFDTFMKEYIPEDQKEGLTDFTDQVSIDKINMCNIWPADNCTTPETCTYYKQCSQTCSSQCVYNPNTFTRFIQPDIKFDGNQKKTFNMTLNGMFYCEGSSKLSAGAGVGIAIGVIVVVVAVLLVVYFLFRRSGGKKIKTQMTNTYI